MQHNFLTMPFSKLSTLDAIHILNTCDVEYLPKDVVNAIANLVNNSRQKEFIKIKPIDNPFKLANLAIDNNEVRYYLRFICSTGEELIGTNGHILIRVKVSLAPGYYDKYGILVHNISKYKFPNLSRILAEMANGDSEKITNHEVNTAPFMNNTILVCKFGAISVQDKYIKIIKKLKVNEVFMSDKGLYFKSHPESNLEFDGVIMRFN